MVDIVKVSFATLTSSAVVALAATNFAFASAYRVAQAIEREFHAKNK